MSLGSGAEHSRKSAGTEHLENFLENAPVGIHMVNPEGVIVFANKAVLELYGFEEDEFIGQPVKKFYQPSDSLDEIVTRLTTGEEFKNASLRIGCKDGSVKDVLLSCNAHFEDGKFKHARCFTRDISEIKKSENLLRFLNQSGDELAATYDTGEALNKIMKFLVPSFADWIVINELKPDGFAHLLKMGHSDPQKVKWAEKYRETHPINIHDPRSGSIGYALRTGEAFLFSEITEDQIRQGALDKEQEQILRELHIKSVMIIPMQIKGRVTGVVSFMSCNAQNIYDQTDFNFAKDFSNRIALTLENAKLYEEVKNDITERIEADKKKDEFISIASHELKTPVTSLKAYTQILKSTFDDAQDQPAVEMLSKMDKQIDKLTALIVDLLDVTKIDKGEMVFSMEEFDFNEAVKEIAEEMQRTSKTHRIILELSDCDPVKGDRNRIGQVIVNFISNAIKYSPGGDHILIRTFCINNKVKLTVHDEGIGIPKEEHGNIFRRFFRVSGKNNYTFPGMGLGLYISSEIIKRHNGRIFFESDEGKGSTFSFEINSHS